MLPVPSVRRRAVQALTEHGCDTVLFGAAAPLGLLAPALRARRGPADRRPDPRPRGRLGGAARSPAACCAASGTRSTSSPTSASTSGSGWPAPCHRRRRRGWPGWPPAWTPRSSARARAAPRSGHRLGLAGRPVVVCVSRLVTRKGQDTLIRAWPLVRAAGDRRAAAAGRQRPGRRAAPPAGPRARRRRFGDVHRARCPGRPARLLRRGRRIRDALPDPPPRPGRRGPGHRLPGGLRDRAAGHRAATPAARRTRCSAARPATWSRGAT